VPQFIGSVSRFTSHPFTGLLSQFAKPALQEPTPQVPPLQPCVALGGATQSLASAHILPTAQGGQDPPPQSISVSLPSLIPSVQEGVTHIPPLQTPEVHTCPGQQLWPTLPHNVVVVVLVVVVVVVVVGRSSGAHTIFGVLGVTMREPNWSCHCNAASVAFGHLTL
jgi:hypothetical protein